MADSDQSKPKCHNGAVYPACALPTDHEGECMPADHPDLAWNLGYHFGRKSKEKRRMVRIVAAGLSWLWGDRMTLRQRRSTLVVWAMRWLIFLACWFMSGYLSGQDRYSEAAIFGVWAAAYGWYLIGLSRPQANPADPCGDSLMSKPLPLRTKPRTAEEAARHFSDPAVCEAFVAQLRWPTGRFCPRCKSADHTRLATRQLWKCRECGKQFSVKSGTFLEGSRLTLGQWLVAIWMTANPRSKNTHELARVLGITQKSAWYMLRRVRLAMDTDSFSTATRWHEKASP